MTKEELNEAIVSEVDDIIYVIDLETFELLYMNRKAMKSLNIREESDWKKQPCYKVLHGREEPCAFCPNAIVKEKGYYSWERYNEKMDRYLYQKYKLITVGGKKAKLGVTTDVTESRKASEELKKLLQNEKTLVKCIRTLYENENIEYAINQLLSIIAKYHCAERAYIFEFDRDGIRMDNTYEWCADGVEPQIDFLQNMEVSIIERWLKQFEEQDGFYINSLSGEVAEDSMEYQLLAVQGVESLMAAPLRMKNRVVGFLGVDNPSKNTDNLLLMQSVSAFVINDIQKRKTVMQLYKLSYCDHLTGIGNRHAYVKFMRDLEERETNCLGIIFADINGLKITNDIYGHERGDKMIQEVVAILREYFGENIFRIGGDEFVVFCIGMPKEEFEERVEKLENAWSSDVAASVGELWLSECSNLEKQVAYADQLMYQNKQEYYRANKGNRLSIDNK